MRAWVWTAAVGWLTAAGCGGLGGGGDVGQSGLGSVSGTAAGRSFSFEASKVAARLDAAGSEAELAITLCENDCAETPGGLFTRVLSLSVRGMTADLRSGRAFEVGRDGEGLALLGPEDGGDITADEAVGGEVVIESSDLRTDGRTIGTFQLRLASGASVQGFFEAPIVSATGTVVVLSGARPASR